MFVGEMSSATLLLAVCGRYGNKDIFGGILVLAAIGELSFFHPIEPKLLFLIPLTRFPGFIWIVAVGFAMPRFRTVMAQALAA